MNKLAVFASVAAAGVLGVCVYLWVDGSKEPPPPPDDPISAAPLKEQAPPFVEESGQEESGAHVPPQPGLKTAPTADRPIHTLSDPAHARFWSNIESLEKKMCEDGVATESELEEFGKALAKSNDLPRVGGSGEKAKAPGRMSADEAAETLAQILEYGGDERTVYLFNIFMEAMDSPTGEIIETYMEALTKDHDRFLDVWKAEPDAYDTVSKYLNYYCFYSRLDHLNITETSVPEAPPAAAKAAPAAEAAGANAPRQTDPAALETPRIPAEIAEMEERRIEAMEEIERYGVQESLRRIAETHPEWAERIARWAEERYRRRQSSNTAPILPSYDRSHEVR